MSADFNAIQSLLKQAHGDASGVPSIESLQVTETPVIDAERLRIAVAKFKEEVTNDKSVIRRLQKFRKEGIYALTPGQWTAMAISAPILIIFAAYFFNLFSEVTRSNLAIRRGLGLVYNHEAPAAIKEMELALSLGAAPGVTRLRFGHALADMDYVDSAILFLDEAAEIGRQTNDIGLLADASARAGLLFLSANQLDAALSRVNKVLVFDARQRDALIVLGKIMMAQSRFDEATEAFINSIERNPTSLMPRYYLWQAYLRQGKMVQAREQEEYLLFARPSGDEDVETLTGYADLLAGAGQLKEAEQVLLGVLKIQRKPMPDIMVSLGHLALENQDLLMAGVYADSAITIAPGHPAGYILRGEIHYRNGDVRKASINFEKALSINPRHEKALYNMGCVMLYDLDMPGAALDHFRRAEVNGFSGSFLWFNIGASEYLLHRGGQALAAWDHLPDYLRQNNDIRWAYANAALLERAADTAIKILSDLRATRGENDPALINNIGVAAELVGDSHTALENYWRAVRTAKTPDAADRIAQANIERMLRNRRLDDVWSAIHTTIELRPRGAASRPRGVRVATP